ncbi:MAG: hypothetical protein ACR2HJ_08230 [Fimbriimonadales bacterium]
MRRFTLCAFAGLLCLPALPIVLGQVDDFEDGTLQNWEGGSDPTNIPDGGSSGAGDNYLQISAGRKGGIHLGTFNLVQWSGSYTDAGVKVLEFYLRNEGKTTLSMRIVLFNGTTRFTSTLATILPPDNRWRRVAFPLRESDLTRVSGTGTYEQTMAFASRLLIRHDAGDPSTGGEAIIGQLGLDDITASAFGTVLPHALTYRRGSNISGGLPSLFFSDDQKLVSRPGPVFSTQLAPVLLELAGTASYPNPATLRFTLESSASTTSLVQKVFLFNYATALFVEFDSRPTTTSDFVIDVPTSEIGKYIDPLTQQMKAQISYRQTGTIFFYPWMVRQDLAVWKLDP